MIIVDKKFGYNTKNKFVFIVSSYNSSKFIKGNLESIKMQIYSKDKYRIIYVNDNSTDNSKKILSDFISKNKTINIELINNKENMGPAYSRYVAYSKAFDDEICIFLDGDDRLVEKNTLRMLSYIYNKFNIFATFGSMVKEEWQYKKWKNYDRTEHNYFPHLRTSYAFLCKKVPINYLKYNNEEWFRFKTDEALFNSITELCNNKYAFIKFEFIYYNRYNSFNNPNTGYKCKTEEQTRIRDLYGDYIFNLKKLKPII